MRKFVAIVLLAALMMTCTKDNPRRLFEMIYPNIEFEIPAGLPGGQVPQALVLDNQPTRYEFFLEQNDLSDERVSAINPASATLSSIDNFGWEFIFALSVRMCPVGAEPCTNVDEVFYLTYEDILDQRGRSDLRLIPSLINAKRILAEEAYKLEVWFNFDFTTPARVDARLDMRFEAVE